MSNTRTVNIVKQTYSPAIDADIKPGSLKAEYFKGKYFKTSELEGKTPDETEHVESLKKVKYHVPDYREIYDDDYHSVVLTGYFEAPENGVYYFSTTVDELWLDNKLFINNEGKVRKIANSDKSIALAKGMHSIKIVRLGNIIGGWPSQWDLVSVMWKKEGQQKFVEMKW
jgi:hexosaminidase